MRNNIKKAYTLAEIMVVLTILGIIASVTIRTVIYNAQKREKITRLKKAYSKLDNAFNTSQAYNGPAMAWTYSAPFDNCCSSRNAKILAQNYLIPYMDVVNECEYINNPTTKCFYGAKNEFFIYEPNSPTDTGSGMVPGTYNGPNGSYMFTTRDGMSFAVKKYGNQGYGEYIRINVDINGPNKGKSVLGDDVFVFEINKASNGNVILEPATKLRWYSSYWDNCVHVPDPNNGAAVTGGGRPGCALLIIKNDWKIPRNYPKNFKKP